MPDEFRRRVDEDVRERLGRFEDRQIEQGETLARVETKVDALNGDLADVKAEVGGAPDVLARGDRETMRDRIHDLENDKAAAIAADTALKTAHAMRDHLWSRWQKIALFALAVAGAAMTLLRLIGVGG